ncbi:glucan endo-1,3-beta-glucosidase-like [Spinacia oleracea]|uniref:Glucan endo-1,3-beta-glucosidase-like n=1 Tax=Spinacia oleracea TaxID=3562 RepID=A0ABM3R9M2_SPIOL|nr:glucan endo-1,3-beta-glucosidase-like [Spinacia oleracea]
MNVNTAAQWVNTNVVPYIKEVNIGWIVVGNEMVPGPTANLVAQAMNNILSGLNSAGITTVKISTAINDYALGVFSPRSLPSAASFTPEATASLQGIVTWLSATNNPLFINVYPYFAFASKPYDVPLDYVLFNATRPVIDGNNKYYSLFEAMVDGFYAAMEKIGGDGVTLVVSETGWPIDGNVPYTNKQNAHIYNQKLVDKMKKGGTPRKPTTMLDIFIFSMFSSENKETAGGERNWGFYYPNLDPVYQLVF